MPQAETNLSNAIVASRELFWRRGFDETSVAEIVAATGMNRYALYNAFGGKLEIFLAVLDAYYAERKNIFLNNLNNPNYAPMDAIRSVFEFAITEMAERGAGCLMCNVASEVGAHEKIVLDRINNYLDEIRGAYTEALARAEARRELNPDITPADGAEILLTLKLGIGARAKHGASAEALMSIFNAGMTALSKAKEQ